MNEYKRPSDKEIYAALPRHLQKSLGFINDNDRLEALPALPSLARQLAKEVLSMQGENEELKDELWKALKGKYEAEQLLKGHHKHANEMFGQVFKLALCADKEAMKKVF